MPVSPVMLRVGWPGIPALVTPWMPAWLMIWSPLKRLATSLVSREKPARNSFNSDALNVWRLGQYGVAIVPLLVVSSDGRQQASLPQDRRAVIAPPPEDGVPLAEVVVHSSIDDVEIA